MECLNNVEARLRFAAGVTLYNPEVESLDHIEDYLRSFDIVIVYDNSDEPDTARNSRIMLLQDETRFVYINGNGNNGLSVAYNSILNEPALTRIDYLCTLDQDSTFEKDEIDRIQAYINEHQDELRDSVAIIGPIIDYGNNRMRPRIKSENVIEDQRYLITSGSFVDLRIMRSHGLRYDINYFIDKFEVDLCMQVRRLGLRVVCYKGAILRQQLGSVLPSGHSGHSALRHYYLFRNRFYFNRKWFNLPTRWVLDVLQTCRHVLYILLYEDEKSSKLFVLGEAIADFLCNRFGARSNDKCRE